jgi:hypothetical protein
METPRSRLAIVVPGAVHAPPVVLGVISVVLRLVRRRVGLARAVPGRCELPLRARQLLRQEWMRAIDAPWAG